MDKALIGEALKKLVGGMAIVAALIFIPAGTVRYPGGWMFLGALFVPMVIMGLVMLKKDPGLLAKRLNSKETVSEQKLVVALSGGMFLGGFVLAGMSFRFGWLCLPLRVQIIAGVLFLGSYAMYAEVMRENSYLSRTVEVQEGQKVIDTGLYGIVRHPMYSSTVLMFLTIPLILGSLLSFFVFLCYPALIALRIKSEEKVLEEGLEGYSEYKKRVRYRLIPFIW